VQRQEHIIYPLAVKWFAQGKLRMLDGRAELNGELLPACGYQIEANQP
jgi:phosphoribosylglycinamide formyltransferase-1